MNILQFAFWPAVEEFERGDARALAAFVRDNALKDPNMRAYVAGVIDGTNKRGDMRKVASEGERLAEAFARAEFVRPGLPARKLIQLIAPAAPDAAEAALRRYWRKHGRKRATPTVSLLLERGVMAAVNDANPKPRR